MTAIRRERTETVTQIAGVEDAAPDNGFEIEPRWVDDEARPRRDWRPFAGALLILLGLGWVGATGYNGWLTLAGSAPALPDLVSFIATLSAPLALLAAIWLLVVRSSRTEQRRFQHTSDAIQGEVARLEATIAAMGARLDDSRAALAAHNAELLTLGDEAANRLAAAARGIETDIEAVGKHANTLTSSAATARGDLAVLLANLPKANVQTRQLITSLQEAGLTAHEKAGALDAQLGLLTARGREADEIAGNAATKLAAHLSRMEGVSEVAGARLEQAAGQMTEAVDAALERAATALDSARQGMEAQGAAMTALLEQHHAALARSGAESAEQLSHRVEAISDQIAGVAAGFAAQDEASQRLVDKLNTDVDAMEHRFALLESGGFARTERLSSAVKALAGHADDMKIALAGGGDTANALVERVESLMTALDAAVREIDETVPAAFIRLEEKSAQGMAAVERAAPAVQALTDTAQAALERLAEADATLARQKEALDALAGGSSAQLEATRETAEGLALAIANAATDAERLTGGAAPQLIDALVRVRETATQASANAKAALAEIIPASAEALGEQSKQALAEALTAQVEDQMAQIGRTTEEAVRAAQAATDRLMRQMLTISETSAGLEARIAEAKDEVERSDQASFARRVALLIESLNSTAIDITKVLSNEVTDTAWAAYLRGDRGVFSRRAVRLLETGEAREISRHYEEEPEFREQVNRFIHDFEAMLRNVLSTREGSALSVTLLSSDTGKLYVALAQAIERLRT